MPQILPKIEDKKLKRGEVDALLNANLLEGLTRDRDEFTSFCNSQEIEWEKIEEIFEILIEMYRNKDISISQLHYNLSISVFEDSDG